MPWTSGRLKVLPEASPSNAAEGWKRPAVFEGIASTILEEMGHHGNSVEITPEALAIFEAALRVLCEKMALGLHFADWAARQKGIHYVGNPSAPVFGKAPEGTPTATPRSLATVLSYEKMFGSLTGGPGKPRVSVNGGVSIPSVCIPISKSRIAKQTKKTPQKSSKKALNV